MYDLADALRFPFDVVIKQNLVQLADDVFQGLHACQASVVVTRSEATRTAVSCVKSTLKTSANWDINRGMTTALRWAKLLTVRRMRVSCDGGGVSQGTAMHRTGAHDVLWIDALRAAFHRADVVRATGGS